MTVRRRLVVHGDDDSGLPATVREGVRFERIGDETAVGELADAAGRIAGDPLTQAAVVNVASVGIGREPFPNSECVASAMVEREAPVGTAYGKCSPIRGDQHVRHRGARGPRDSQRRQRKSAPTQRRFQQTDDEETRRRQQKRAGAEQRDSAERAGETRNP